MARLFAISDIHGCFKPFYELVVNVISLNKTDRLILLGDYIDRGSQSKEVIDFIIDLCDSGFNITPLAGNHEVMLCDAHYDPRTLPLWLMNSGTSTLDSFGIRDIRSIDPHYMNFFTKLKYYESFDNFIFVHAGFNDNATDPFSDRYSMIWNCLISYKNPVFLGKTIIHGHRAKTITFIRNLIKEKSAVIPIDTGCVYDREMGYGNLTALELNSMMLFSVPNR